MKKICIFHFSPLELFPPVMNMISFLDKELPGEYSIRVYTTRSGKNLKLYTPNSKRIVIKRFGNYDVVLSGFNRFKLYITYNLFSFLNAFFWRPEKVLYYETFSAIPAFGLKKIKPGIQLYIHYHEYMSPSEYNNSGLLKKLHEIEKKNYDKAIWISHTNEDRLQLFLRDVGIINHNGLQVMPNFPSRYWGEASERKLPGQPVKIVHVGAIGLDSLYIKEFAQWVENQHGKVSWDIYSQHDSSELEALLKSIDSKFTYVRGYISYQNLPEALSNYDVGVILYKGVAPNVIYSAPNKLFEYLACGLDVWLSQELKGALSYVKTNSYPKVVSVSFKQPEDLVLEKLIEREGLLFKPTEYYYEEQYKGLLSVLMQ